MRLKLERLRHNVAGPLVDPLFADPWRIGAEKEVDNKVGHQLLAKYPDFFSEMEAASIDNLKKARPPRKDKMFRNVKDKDKAVGS